MNTLRGSRTPDGQPRTRIATRPLVVSVVLHIGLIFFLAHTLISPRGMWLIFGRPDVKEVPVERIGFLRLPQADGPAVEGRSGGDGRPLSETVPSRIVAPQEVPAGVPVFPPATDVSPEAGSGPLVGGGGPTQGIRPAYTSPRVWAPTGDIVSAPKTAKEKLDSAIVSIIAPFNDSLAVASGQRKPGDWTFERGGRKYGIDPQYIRLGKVSIPTAVLALLPINQTANPTMTDRNRMQNQLRSDIFWQAQRGMNEADFKKAVKSIRERKERERKQAAESKTRQPDDEPAASQPTSR